MSETFVIELAALEQGPVEVAIRPAAAEVEAYFSDLGGSYEPADADGFLADLRVYKDDASVYVDGVVRASFKYRCGRCLAEREVVVEKDVHFVLMSRQRWVEAYGDEDEIALRADDMDVSFYEGDTFDLAPLYREAVLLELPAFPRCGDAMREACDRAFEANVGDEAIEAQARNAVDMRWWPLRELELAEKEDEEASDEASRD